MDALGLDKCRDAEVGFLLDVVLGGLDMLEEPFVWNRDTDIKRAPTVLGAPFQARLIESIG